jgi:hypothetical protein
MNTSLYLQDLRDMKNGKKFNTALTVQCKNCQYNVEPRNGYTECWENLSSPQHHIFELNYGTTIGGYKSPYFDTLISERKISLFDIDFTRLTGLRANRQKIQIEFTKNNESLYAKELKKVVSEIKYPITFIDFETARLKIPPYKNMLPNELLAFQWSYHLIKEPGSVPIQAHS